MTGEALPRLPVSVVIPTRNRSSSLTKTLNRILEQRCVPSEIIVVDSSDNDETSSLVARLHSEHQHSIQLKCLKADIAGAAPQRNQGAAASGEPYLLFLDDDIFFQDGCMNEIWEAMQSEANVVGVTPIYVGESYSPPGKFGSLMMAFLNGRSLESYAGRVLGPGFTRLPDASDHLPRFVEIEWMGSGCAFFRKSDLPNPPFPDRFQGASLFEDLCLSLVVGKKGKILNARMGVAIHANEGGDHKRGRYRLAKMELQNRYYIMSQILERKGVVDHFKFFVMMSYMTIGAFWRPRRWAELPAHLAGLLVGSLMIPFQGQ